MGTGPLVAFRGVQPSRCELGGGVRPLVRAGCRDRLEPFERLPRRVQLATRDVDLHEQLEQRCTGRAGDVLPLKAQTRSILGQRQVSPRQRDLRQQLPRGRTGLAALEQPLGLLEPPPALAGLDTYACASIPLC
jgi:hypothetical protein